MKLVRNAVLMIALGIAAMFGVTAKAADKELAGYTYRMDDGVIVFDTTPCADELILTVVSEEIKPRLKSAVAIPADPKEGKIALCWLDNGVFIQVGTAFNSFNIPLNDPRLTRRDKI